MKAFLNHNATRRSLLRAAAAAGLAPLVSRAPRSLAAENDLVVIRMDVVLHGRSLLLVDSGHLPDASTVRYNANQYR